MNVLSLIKKEENNIEKEENNIEKEKNSIKKEENNIREFLKIYLNKIINENHEKFNDFCNIMRKQEKWDSKIKNIISFRVVRSRLNKALNLQLKVKNFNKWVTVSWKKGTTKKRKEKDPLQSAFRQSIKTQIFNWKKMNKLGALCNNCRASRLLQADHKFPTFINLTKTFLDNEKNIPTEFDYHYKCGRKFQKKDNYFKLKWQKFHKKYATLQWLCRSCNLKKKKYLKDNLFFI